MSEPKEIIATEDSLLQLGAEKVISRYDALREVLLDWDNYTLREVVTDACWRDEDLVNLIIDNDMLGGPEEEDRILREASRMDEDGKILPAPVLCGGAKTPSEERAKYKEAMHG